MGKRRGGKRERERKRKRERQHNRHARGEERKITTQQVESQTAAGLKSALEAR